MYSYQHRQTTAHPIDASSVCLFSAQRPHLLGRLPIEEERFAVGTPCAEELTIRGETDNVHKTTMDLLVW